VNRQHCAIHHAFGGSCCCTLYAYLQCLLRSEGHELQCAHSRTGGSQIDVHLWCIVSGVWCVVYREWCVVCGVWCVVCGVWCIVCGVWCVVCGVWCVVCGVWSVVCGVGVGMLSRGGYGE
jgi:hypothetical protein